MARGKRGQGYYDEDDFDDGFDDWEEEFEASATAKAIGVDLWYRVNID